MTRTSSWMEVTNLLYFSQGGKSLLGSPLERGGLSRENQRRVEQKLPSLGNVVWTCVQSCSLTSGEDGWPGPRGKCSHCSYKSLGLGSLPPDIAAGVLWTRCCKGGSPASIPASGGQQEPEFWTPSFHGIVTDSHVQGPAFASLCLSAICSRPTEGHHICTQQLGSARAVTPPAAVID